MTVTKNVATLSYSTIVSLMEAGTVTDVELSLQTGELVGVTIRHEWKSEQYRLDPPVRPHSLPQC
jgi:hypothetical protein